MRSLEQFQKRENHNHVIANCRIDRLRLGRNKTKTVRLLEYRPMRHALAASTSVVFVALSGPYAPALAAGEVNVYSYRQPYLLQPVLDQFSKESGIAVHVLYMDRGLVERMQVEGVNSPADLIISGDLGRMAELKQAGLTQAPGDPALAAAIPAAWRDSDGQWWGLGTDIRAIYVAKDRVISGAFSYQDLANPSWKGRLCMRDGRHASNLAVIGAMIAAKGEKGSADWLASVRANLADRPNGNDRSQIEAIAAGTCDIALGYAGTVGAMLAGTDTPARKSAEAVRVAYPADGILAANLSGMALAKNAPHRAEALKLMQFLATKGGQSLYVSQTLEYPVTADASAPKVMETFGKPAASQVSAEQVWENHDRAAQLVDSGGLDDGPVN
jgi:iron(III) transport system substrate-binding protein